MTPGESDGIGNFCELFRCEYLEAEPVKVTFRDEALYFHLAICRAISSGLRSQVCHGMSETVCLGHEIV
jgi:hypothetical protein